MTNVTPALTAALPGKLTAEDVKKHLVVYGDPTTHRRALLMEIAHEARSIRKRKVLFITENDDVHSLKGFAVYKPDPVLMDAEYDSGVVFRLVDGGKSVILNLGRLDEEAKFEMINALLTRMTDMDYRNLTMVIDRVESVFSRRFNAGVRSGVNIMQNLMGRMREVDGEVAMSCLSPGTCAIELPERCGIPIVGLTTNRKCAKAIGKEVDPKLAKYSGEIFGLQNITPVKFYIYNAYNVAMEKSEEEIGDTLESVLHVDTMPRLLEPITDVCGYDPNDPEGTKSENHLGTKEQEELERQMAERPERQKEKGLDIRGAKTTLARKTTKEVKKAARKPKTISGRERNMLANGQSLTKLLEAAGVKSTNDASSSVMAVEAMVQTDNRSMIGENIDPVRALSRATSQIHQNLVKASISLRSKGLQRHGFSINAAALTVAATFMAKRSDEKTAIGFLESCILPKNGSGIDDPNARLAFMQSAHVAPADKREIVCMMLQAFEATRNGRELDGFLRGVIPGEGTRSGTQLANDNHPKAKAA